MKSLTGWGLTSPTSARLVEPGDTAELRRLVMSSSTAIPRGAGRSYGDPAQSAGATVISGLGFKDIGPVADVMSLGGGVTIDDLLRRSVPSGWFVPVTPGTRFVTMGGAFAADIHGKNNHRVGSFSQHVQDITLMLADGSEVTVGPTDPLFQASAGGMGLTGVITSLRLRMLPIETSRMVVDTTRISDLEGLLAAMLDADARSTYSVAWVDTLARGKNLGRSVLTTGEHARLEDLAGRMRSQPLTYSPRQLLRTPARMPNWALNQLSVSAFNELWFRKAPKRGLGEIQGIPAFFHPLDGVRDWNRVYGSRGFLQYQFVVEDAEVVRHALQRVSERRCPVFLAVLKRFGPGNASPLSFPTAGWTLALDIPTDVDGLSGLLDEWDERVVAAGGRIYLAKDSRLSSRHLEAMYPRLAAFREVREQVDPQRRWRSDLSRRLGI